MIILPILTTSLVYINLWKVGRMHPLSLGVKGNGYNPLLVVVSTHDGPEERLAGWLRLKHNRLSWNRIDLRASSSLLYCMAVTADGAVLGTRHRGHGKLSIGKISKTNDEPSLRISNVAGYWAAFVRCSVRPRQKRGHIVAATLCPAMLPVRGKTRQHCCAPRDFWKRFLCLQQMLRTWQNESIFGKHDPVSNVAATMCAPYPTRMLFSRSIAWIGKRVITYYLKTLFCLAWRYFFAALRD